MFRTIAIALLFTLPLFAAEVWTVDESHATARFKVQHMMVSNVSGEIAGMKGKFEIDEAEPKNLKIDVSLQANTINTNNAKRDEHLKNSDFLDVKKYPTITFKSKKVSKDGNQWSILGDLTLHGVTKEVTFLSGGLTAPVKDPWGNMRRGFVATTKLSRKEFGITWNKTLDNGGLVVGDEVDVTVECELLPVKKMDKKS